MTIIGNIGTSLYVACESWSPLRYYS